MMINGRVLLVKGLALALVAGGCFSSFAPAGASYQATAGGGATPELNELDSSKSEMRPVIERYVADHGSLSRSYPVESSPARLIAFKQFYSDWLALIGKMNFDAMSQDGKVDYALFKFHVEREQQRLEIQNRSLAEIAPLLPFAQTITSLAEARRRMEKLDPPKVAAQLNDLTKQIETTRRALEAGLRAEPGKAPKSAANRAAPAVNSLRGALRAWFGYYNGYDPLFTWWMEEPYKAVDQALGDYAAYLTEKVVGLRPIDAGPTLAQARAQAGDPGRASGAGGGQRGAGGGFGGGNFAGPAGRGGVTVNARTGDSSDIIGDPIGRDALMIELASEMIPYTPEELIAIAYKELDWCEGEMKKASRELGFGDDWRKALEFVKNKFVEPGKQTEVIRELALEAIEYVEKNNLVTVPPLARESWRMEMMSPERQLVNPFFTGGEVISVSYPTNAMSHEAKMMSMRGNNPHFSRATVQHELIPGHHLQGFMTRRSNRWRSRSRQSSWFPSSPS